MKDALRLLASELVDLVLCDLMMPAMSGVDVFASLMTTDSALASQMVFSTGGAFTSQARHFVETASIVVIEKPFKHQALREFIRQRMQRRTAAMSRDQDKP